MVLAQTIKLAFSFGGWFIILVGRPLFMWWTWMAKDFAKAFYKTKQWKNCRAAYMASVGGLCERCYRNGLIVPGDIVHHKIHLTPENIKDPTVALNWKNLECLCRLCHNDEHKGDFLDGRTDLIQKRYRIDEFGRVII